MHLSEMREMLPVTGAVTCIDVLTNKALCSGGTDRTIHLWNWAL